MDRIQQLGEDLLAVSILIVAAKKIFGVYL